VGERGKEAISDLQVLLYSLLRWEQMLLSPQTVLGGYFFLKENLPFSSFKGYSIRISLPSLYYGFYLNNLHRTLLPLMLPANNDMAVLGWWLGIFNGSNPLVGALP